MRHTLRPDCLRIRPPPTTVTSPCKFFDTPPMPRQPATRPASRDSARQAGSRSSARSHDEHEELTAAETPSAEKRQSKRETKESVPARRRSTTASVKKAGTTKSKPAKPSPAKLGSSKQAPRKRGKAGASAADDLDQTFVPKAPPPGQAAGSSGPGPRPLEYSAPLEVHDPGVNGSSLPARAGGTPDVATRAAVAATPLAPSTLGTTSPLRITCQLCAYPLPRTAKFCRRCGVRQLPQESAAPVQLKADEALVTAPIVPSLPVLITASEPAEAPPPQLSILPLAGPRDHTEQMSAEPAQADEEREAQAPKADDSVPPVDLVSCRHCDKPLPSVARYCMFCGGAQDAAVAGANTNAPDPADTLSEIEASASAGLPGHDAMSSEAAPNPGDQGTVTLNNEGPVSTAPDQSEASSPGATASVVEGEPAPEDHPAAPSLLAADVLARLDQARHDIDAIGRDLERLSRRAIAAKARPTRPDLG